MRIRRPIECVFDLIEWSEELVLSSISAFPGPSCIANCLLRATPLAIAAYCAPRAAGPADVKNISHFSRPRDERRKVKSENNNMNNPNFYQPANTYGRDITVPA